MRQRAWQRLAALPINKGSLKLETVKPAQHPAAGTSSLRSNSKPITGPSLGWDLAHFGSPRQGHRGSCILHDRQAMGPNQCQRMALDHGTHKVLKIDPPPALQIYRTDDSHP